MAGFFDTLFGGGAEREAADKNRALLAQYQATGLDQLAQGYQTGQTNLGSAIGAYDPLAALGKKYGGASDLYLGALGAAGPAGTEAARAAFTNAPGYTGAITAGLDAINRRRGVGGMYGSGNADEDALTFAQNLQNQQYNTWLQNLAGAGQTGVQATGAAATGQAGGYTNLANLAQNYAGAQTGLEGSVATGLQNANIGEAAGQAAGAKNLLGAGFSLASLGLGIPLGGGGSSSGGYNFSASPLGALTRSASNLFLPGGSPSGYGA
jgi:hypothetical protein